MGKENSIRLGDYVKEIGGKRIYKVQTVDDMVCCYGITCRYGKIAHPEELVKIEKFDPTLLEPFAKVLVRFDNDDRWKISFFERVVKARNGYTYSTILGNSRQCVPYNKETKVLVDTDNEVPEFYKI